MNKHYGFTILELLVVLAVIAILVGIAVPRIKGMQDQSNITKAQSETKTIQTAIESYYINQTPNAYPASSTSVVGSTLSSQTPNIIATALYDPFLTTSTEYNYIRSSNGQYYVIFSVGPDGTADITGISDTGIIQGTDDDDVFATNGSGF